ncbi:hypothetical protein Loa_00557 [Legionella oakridgensis ATCC 33761 = DSM 21215]|uniref:Uncharacterized protein n=1 Tax=Legionella oakridgensis ATCC 33761 = DSM 21215 TaxID=1268635 RepID=W0BBX3_9GAMM|nr:hypothetical protein [Legionella oakridgensis]AHE66127.1 hypothetical protein Loa_00557 [Legionella oakridgensis ATCC 33761 = DSM 21215]
MDKQPILPSLYKNTKHFAKKIAIYYTNNTIFWTILIASKRIVNDNLLNNAGAFPNRACFTTLILQAINPFKKQQGFLMNNKLQQILEHLIPFIMLGIAIAFAVGLLMMFFYVVIWGIIIGGFIWLVVFIKTIFSRIKLQKTLKAIL